MFVLFKEAYFYASWLLFTSRCAIRGINWAVINHLDSVDFEEYKRIMHAEVLVPDNFPLDEMLSISVSSKEMVETVRALFAELGLTEDEFDLPIVYKPNLFL